MQLGRFPLDEATDAVLAHAVKLPGRVFKKGTKIDAEVLGILRAAGEATVWAAKLDADDVAEDDAALTLAEHVAGANIWVEDPFTGRSNLFAQTAGLFRVDAARVHALNRIDPALTLATLPDRTPVEAGRMVATVKIIPFAVPRATLKAGLTAVTTPPLSLRPFRPKTVGLVSTELPSLKASVIDKTARTLGDRLKPAGATLGAHIRARHDTEALAASLRDLALKAPDLIVIFGASAIVDEGDVLPQAIREAGGTVHHVGMPVDPGNLLVLGDLGGKPVLGAPGCARSPKENGFDWVLNRLLADEAVTSDDIIAMGVGGLLMDIVSRPQPRGDRHVDTSGPATPRIAALVLAAGLGRRMGGPNKLLATLDGVPLVRRVVAATLQSRTTDVTVVTGHRAEETHDVLQDLNGNKPLAFAHNPQPEAGLAASLKAGLATVPAEADAVIVLLGDMPLIDAATIDALIAAYDPAAGQHIVVPTAHGKRGNPVIIGRRFFAELEAIEGDQGARGLFRRFPEAVAEVPLDDRVLADADTPQALAAIGGQLGPSR